MIIWLFLSLNTLEMSLSFVLTLLRVESRHLMKRIMNWVSFLTCNYFGFLPYQFHLETLKRDNSWTVWLSIEKWVNWMGEREWIWFIWRVVIGMKRSEKESERNGLWSWQTRPHWAVPLPSKRRDVLGGYPLSLTLFLLGCLEESFCLELK